MKSGKRYAEAMKNVDRSALYDVADAIALVKKNASAKFDETVEVHIRTGCDGRHADQQIRGAVVLPHGTGKKVRILVFAKDAKAEASVRIYGNDYRDNHVALICCSCIEFLGKLNDVNTVLTKCRSNWWCWCCFASWNL